MTDIPFTLMRRWPGNLWDIKGDDYSTLNWISGPDPKPTETEINTAFAEETVICNWEIQMEATDRDVPRAIEDIYDALQEDAQARVPQITRDKITAKKTLRGQKP